MLFLLLTQKNNALPAVDNKEDNMVENFLVNSTALLLPAKEIHVIACRIPLTLL